MKMVKLTMSNCLSLKESLVECFMVPNSEISAISITKSLVKKQPDIEQWSYPNKIMSKIHIEAKSTLKE